MRKLKDVEKERREQDKEVDERQRNVKIYCYLPKTKKFGCVGKGDLSPYLSFVFKICEIDRSQGRLVK